MREIKRDRDPGSACLFVCYSCWFHWLIELACQQSRCHSVSEFVELLRVTAAANRPLFPGGKGSPVPCHNMKTTEKGKVTNDGQT